VPGREYIGATFDNLAEMLNRASDERAAFAQEAREKVVAVSGGVDCESREGNPRLGVRNERIGL
jgi:hypothetical protein